jgi:hypothetical protein
MVVGYPQGGAYTQTTVTTAYANPASPQPPVYIYGKLKKKAFKKAHGF